MSTVKSKHHYLLVDTHESAICHCGCRSHAERLSCKPSLSEEIARIQYADGSFLAILRNDGEPYFSFQDIKDRITICALRVDCSFPWKGHNFSALTDGGEELFRVEITLFLTCTHRAHDPVLPVKSVVQAIRGHHRDHRTRYYLRLRPLLGTPQLRQPDAWHTTENAVLLLPCCVFPHM